MAKYAAILPEISAVGLAVSDPNRVRLLMALSKDSLCVCQMTALLGLAPSTVSKHLSVLKQARLVTERKEGRWVFHQLCDCDCSCHPVIDWVKDCLKQDSQIAADRERIKEILKMDPEELCRK